MKAISEWSTKRAGDVLSRVELDEFPLDDKVRRLARELDNARELGKQDALRVLNKAAQEFESKGEDGIAFVCRSVGKYVKATA